MGHIIPAGTGFDRHRGVVLKMLVDVPEDEPASVASNVDETSPLLA